MILLEAMAAETPIVASDLPGYRNVVDPEIGCPGLRGGGSGAPAAVLVPPDDAAALGAGLRRVLEDPDLAASLTAAGDARASVFSMDHLAERYVSLYHSAMEGPRPV